MMEEGVVVASMNAGTRRAIPTSPSAAAAASESNIYAAMAPLLS